MLSVYREQRIKGEAATKTPEAMILARYNKVMPLNLNGGDDLGGRKRQADALLVNVDMVLAT